MVKRNLYLVPLIIVTLTVFYSTIIVLTTDVIFGYKHYLAFLLITASVISSFVKKELCIYLTGITLLLGTLNVIAFTPAIEAYSFGFSLNDKIKVAFKLQLYSFIVLILYLILNGRFLLSKINKTINDKTAY